MKKKRAKREIIYKDIPGYQGLYQATNNGQIWSVRRKVFLSPFANHGGYYQVRLFNKKEKEQFELSRLIYETFHGPIPKGYDCHHLNGKRDCNYIENLAIIPEGEHRRFHALGRKKKGDKFI